MALDLFDLVTLVVPLAIILTGCELFTNGVEWLGVKLGLAERATGSVLAAVGTALPETVVPIIAIIFASTEAVGDEIAAGAILGAPFMLATLAMLIGGIAVYVAMKRGRRSAELCVEQDHLSLDVKSFVFAYIFAIAAAFFMQGATGEAKILRGIVAVVLFILYGLYVRKMIRHESGPCEKPEGLYFCRILKSHAGQDPKMRMVMSQVIISLAMIIVGARIFVFGVEAVAGDLGISTIVLAFLIAPIATELPEKFNSVLWYWRGRDTLALGNITGAMVFQSSVPVSIGLLFTNWTLEPINIASMFFAIAAIGFIYVEMKIFKKLTYKSLLASGLFYLVYIILIMMYPPAVA